MQRRAGEPARTILLRRDAVRDHTKCGRATVPGSLQLTRSRWHDDQQWRITYDERGLVGTVDWFDPQDSAWLSVADYDREMTGLPEVRNTDFGQTRSYSYDALARPLTDVLALNGLPAPLAERDYTYTDAGDLASVVGHTNDVSASAVYEYDAHHRLLSADGPNGYRGRFTYSPTGNVRSADVTWAGASQTRNVNYTYGQIDPQAVDELVDAATGDTFAAFVYDDVGNMTWRSTPEGDQLLHWDGRDQIRSADTGEGLETYLYDHTGQRTLAVDAEGGVRFWFGERETHFGQDGIESLTYLHLSGGGPTLARVENGTTIELQYADALQNLMFSLDRLGTVKSSFLYGPFGEVVFETGGDEHRRQFNGKESDVATGLRYYGFRYYDPVTLRWSSADPLYTVLPDLGLNEPQRMNLYAFSLNNPVRLLDPDGLEPPNGGTTVTVGCMDGTDNCTEDQKNAAFVKEARRVFSDLDDAQRDALRRQKLAWAQYRELVAHCAQVGCSTGESASGYSYPARDRAFATWENSVVASGRAQNDFIHFNLTNKHAPDRHYYFNSPTEQRKRHELEVYNRKKLVRQLELTRHAGITISATTRSDLISIGGAAVGVLLIVTEASTPLGATIIFVDLGVNLLNNHGYFD